MARVVVISVAWLIAAQNGQQAEPVTKIVDTLQNVFANLNEEHKSDETTYKKFYDWCQGNFVTRKNEHQRFKTGVSELQSKLQVQQAQNKQLKDEAGQLEEEVKQTKEAIAEATSMRQQEHQDYLREESNFAQVLQSLNRGVDVLQSSTSKQALLQVTNSLQQLASQSAVVTDAQRDQLQQFAQRASQTSDDEDVISQSSSVVQVLHELINNFQQSAAAAVEQEKSALEQYDSLITLKKQSFSQVVSSKDTKDALLAESLQRTAQVQRSLEDGQATIGGMEQYLQGLQNVCSHKSSQWAARSASREEILEGLQRSLAALQGDSAALKSLHLAPRPPPSFLQTAVVPNLMGMLPVGASPGPEALAQFAAPPQPQFAAPQQAGGMLAVQQSLNNAHKENTYSSVKGMVETMIAQMSSQTEDESKHKEWCDAEITKSKSAQDEKSARLQRLATKIDNERETVNQLDSDLALEGTNSQSLQKALEELAKIRMDERDLHTKAGQNHAMAQQILSQATAILQRVNALAQQAQQPQTYGFLQASGASSMQAVSSAAVESLSGLQTQYTTLMGACDKGETQANLDLDSFGRASQTLQETLARSHNYKTSVRLQAMSALDQDTEDETALKTQVQSVAEYVNRLRSSCAGILQHYDERSKRRDQSLQILKQAKSVINVDNAEEIHEQLQTLARGTDQMAASLVTTSAHLAPAAAVPAAGQAPAQLGSLTNGLSELSMAYGTVQQAPFMQPAQLVPAQRVQLPPQAAPLQAALQAAPQPGSAQSIEALLAQAPAQQPAPPSSNEGTASILKDLEGLAQLAK
jgi:hypothetical protein